MKPRKGTLCAYCGWREGTTRDHVFARSFFPVASRGYLPKVPVCDHCNGVKAALESDLACVLPFGGEHADAPQLLEMVSSRLDNNHRVARSLELDLAIYIDPQDSFSLKFAPTVPIDGDKLQGLFEWVARGLFYFHWQRPLRSDYSSCARVFPTSAVVEVESLLRGNVGARASGNYGNGAFVYEAAHATDNADSSVWKFHALGGMSMGTALQGGHPLRSVIVVTGRHKFISELRGMDGEQANP